MRSESESDHYQLPVTSYLFTSCSGIWKKLAHQLGQTRGAPAELLHDGVERVAGFVAGRGAQRAVAREHAQADAIELGRHLGVVERRRRRRPAQHALDGVERAASFEQPAR